MWIINCGNDLGGLRNDLGCPCETTVWCASVASWLITEILNKIKELIMSVIEKLSENGNIELIVTAVVGAGALLLCGVA